MAKPKNPPKSREQFIPTPSPGWKGARPRGGSEWHARESERRIRAGQIDRRFKLTDPTAGHPEGCGCYYCGEKDREPRELVGIAPLDANAARHLRRKVRRQRG